jgi:hypothetical protein
MGSFGKPIRGRSRPFSRPIIPRVPLGSFRKTVVGFVRENGRSWSKDIFRNSTHHNGPMGSFGETVSREMSPVYATHSPEIANGFVSQNGRWLRSGKTAPPGARTFFGTQHIITGQWVRLGKPFRGRCRPFMRPILPRLPLGSFGRAVVGFVRGNTPHLEQGHFSELNTSERVLASFGEAVSWEPSTAFSTHLPEYAIGFVAHVPSLVKSHKVPT